VCGIDLMKRNKFFAEFILSENKKQILLVREDCDFRAASLRMTKANVLRTTIAKGSEPDGGCPADNPRPAKTKEISTDSP